jgi:hypothetical protein
MDVRAKQRLCYQRRPLNLNLSVVVSRHVNAAVRCFVFKNTKRGGFEIQAKTLRVKPKLARRETAC